MQLERKKLNKKEQMELMETAIIVGTKEISAILKKYGLKFQVAHSVRLVSDLIANKEE